MMDSKDYCSHCGHDLESYDIPEEYGSSGYCSKECEVAKRPIPVIRPIFELLAYDIGGNPERWEKAIYRGTECGANFSIVDIRTLSISSIVEGSEAEFYTAIRWPFTRKEFWNVVDSINNQACKAWELANNTSEVLTPDELYQWENANGYR